MTYEFYKILHLLGIFLVFAALGGQLLFVLNGGDKHTNKTRALLGATHGVGLLVLLVAGFGMHAKLGIDGFPGWMIGKLVLWALLGAWIALPWRAPKLAGPMWFLLPVVGLLATWLAVTKPF